MTLRTITLDADDLDKVAELLARHVPDDVVEAERDALQRFSDAIDGKVVQWPIVRRTFVEVIGGLFPFPTVIGPDGAAHLARSRR
jgi:hypothetical protein